MLLSITCHGSEAADLGYLLHKNPGRPQSFSLSHGQAYVFYPEVAADKCTVCLLLDLDPLDLAKGRVGDQGGGLFNYVSDRPYASSSFMSVALAKVYGTAMSGRCRERQEVADRPLDLSAELTMLPCRSGPEWLTRLFEPLGYQVEFTANLLDEKFPEWGKSPYVNLRLKGRQRLADLLKHLYVLIPVFDRQKHYWVDRAEIDKLLRLGEGWLEEHPAKEHITTRYFNKLRQYSRQALDRLTISRLDNGEGGVEEDQAEEDETTPKPPRLNVRRLEVVVEVLKNSGAQSVIDLGCGTGSLLRRLLKEKMFTRLAGVDVSVAVLERARRRLRYEEMSEAQRARLSFFQGALTYKDDRFAGFDAATVIEVVEHLDKSRLAAFERVLFGEAAPRTVVLTTPNIEYNENYEGLGERLRHGDHRFEWTREEFRAWGDQVAARYGYEVEYGDIGEIDEELGTPTQMGVFKKCA